MSKLNTLVYHGRSKSTAKWVIDTYGNREDYKNHQSIQEWLEASREVLSQPDEDITSND